jgi:hypothetical protein
VLLDVQAPHTIQEGHSISISIEEDNLRHAKLHALQDGRRKLVADLVGTDSKRSGFIEGLGNGTWQTRVLLEDSIGRYRRGEDPVEPWVPIQDQFSGAQPKDVLGAATVWAAIMNEMRYNYFRV